MIQKINVAPRELDVVRPLEEHRERAELLVLVVVGCRNSGIVSHAPSARAAKPINRARMETPLTWLRGMCMSERVETFPVRAENNQSPAQSWAAQTSSLPTQPTRPPIDTRRQSPWQPV
ncbi:MAG: hypothetical protein HC783_13635, partial [Rhodobacteraceae bacterium]|nr:hypothetical protein [Paracoccaceae bacterium]